MRTTLVISTLVIVACGGSVVVTGEGEGGAASSASSSSATFLDIECWRCLPGHISLQWSHPEVPWCEGEREKYDALLACACQENTCLDFPGCAGAGGLVCDPGGGYGARAAQTASPPSARRSGLPAAPTQTTAASSDGRSPPASW